jgi:hypothetical protein
MASKQAAEGCITTKQHPAPAAPKTAEATTPTDCSPSGDHATALPARFLEGTAWDEV